MTPAQRSLIERMLTEPLPSGAHFGGLTNNIREAILAQRDDLETSEARVKVLEEAVEKWERIVEQHGHRVDQVHGDSP